MIRFSLIFIIVLMVHFVGLAQTQTNTSALPDSLHEAYVSLAEDTSKVNFLNEFVAKHFFSDPNRCLSVLKQAQLISQRTADFKQNIIAYNFSITYYQLSQWDSVIHYGQRALAITDSITETSRYGLILSNLATTMRTIGKEEEANTYRLRSRFQYEKVKDTLGLAIIDNDLGLYYFDLGQFARSLDYFQKSLKGLELKKHETGAAIVLNNIGMIIHQQKDYEAARSYYRRSYETAQDIDAQQHMGSTLNNMGSSFQDEGLLDSALHYHGLALQIQEDVNDFGNMGISYNNFGIIYSKKKNYAQAAKNHQEAIKHAQEAGNLQVETDAMIKLGKAQKAMGEINLATTNLQNGLALATELNSLQLQQESNEALYEIYKTTSPARALQYLEEAAILRDSLLNEEKIRELAIKEKDFEYEKEKSVKENEIALLNANAQLQQLQIARSNRNLSILGTIIVLLGFIIYYIYLNRKKMQNLNRELTRQKHLLESALGQKEMLIKEIHHRVKNNLQVVSSLLGIQSRHVKDQAALDAIKAGRARVHSMALIHQDLYKEDNPTSIELRTYFSKLVSDLMETYDLSEDRITLSSDIDEIFLDVDTVIPVGLILNELISNALKYAFPAGKGSIHVDMHETEKGFLLRIKDDGIGMLHPSKKSHDSFGYDLIESLINNMDGEWNIKSDQGTEVTILLKNYNEAV